jgi:hypothetical protein
MAPLKGDDGSSGILAPPKYYGVWGDAFGADGVVGTSNNFGVRGVTTTASRLTAAGVLGLSEHSAGTGVAGGSDDGSGVLGIANRSGQGVFGIAGTGSGVLGEAYEGTGVQGKSNRGTGVYGSSTSGPGVYGVGNPAVQATSNDLAIFAWASKLAGWFIGDVRISGNLSKSGGGFTIDHPVDPERRYLHHSFVESPERKNLYDGIAVCDDLGEAIVKLPAWFEALNQDLRYQLTPVGAPAPSLHVAAEVKGGHFKIAGGVPGLKVSWQVTGARRDAWARSHPLAVEEDKTADERGYFLHPEAYGHTTDRSVHRRHHAEAHEHLNRPPVQASLNLPDQQLGGASSGSSRKEK